MYTLLIPTKSIKSLPSVQNAASKFILGDKKHDDVKPALIALHWFPIEYHILFKVLLLIPKSLSGQGPQWSLGTICACTYLEVIIRMIFMHTQDSLCWDFYSINWYVISWSERQVFLFSCSYFCQPLKLYWAIKMCCKNVFLFSF